MKNILLSKKKKITTSLLRRHMYLSSFAFSPRLNICRRHRENKSTVQPVTSRSLIVLWPYTTAKLTEGVSCALLAPQGWMPLSARRSGLRVTRYLPSESENMRHFPFYMLILLKERNKTPNHTTSASSALK